MGEPKAVTIDKLRSIVESKGAVLVSKEYINNHSKIEFLCSNCGNLWYITWKSYCKGQNPNFLCYCCMQEALKIKLRKMKQGVTIEELRSLVESKGAHLISTKYVNDRTPLLFNCANCGKEWSFQYTLYKRGENMDFLCQDCRLSRLGRRNWNLESVRKFFKDGGSELYSKEYINGDQILEYKCVHCGNKGEFGFEKMLSRHSDVMFYCNACIRGKTLNPTGNYGGQRRHLYDLQWFKYIYAFYNLTKSEQKIYSAHHIKQFKVFPDYRTSFCNGFPIKTIYHDLGAKDPETGLSNPFHNVAGYMDVVDYPDYVRLSYHNYTHFRFLDLNSKLVTEIIAPKEDLDENYLLSRYENFKSKGLLYVPFFFDELFVEGRLTISCSIVRRLLFNWFSDIYKYTGQDYSVYCRKQLNIQSVTGDQACDFCKVNSLFGFKESSYYLGLYADSSLVGLLSFGIKGSMCTIESYIEKCNCVVTGGFELLFDYIKDTYSLEKVVYEFDARFPLVSETNFSYSYRTAPLKVVMNKRTNRFFKSMMQASYGYSAVINSGKTVNTQNGLEKDFVTVSDLGNLVYVWEKSKI